MSREGVFIKINITINKIILKVSVYNIPKYIVNFTFIILYALFVKHLFW